MGKHLDILLILFVVVRMQFSKTEDKFSKLFHYSYNTYTSCTYILCNKYRKIHESCTSLYKYTRT